MYYFGRRNLNVRTKFGMTIAIYDLDYFRKFVDRLIKLIRKIHSYTVVQLTTMLQEFQISSRG